MKLSFCIFYPVYLAIPFDVNDACMIQKMLIQFVNSSSDLNLANVNDEHGDHVTTNSRDNLSHRAKQKEFGSLFGYF